MFKKVLFTAAAIAAFSACSDENNDNSSNGSGNQDVGKIVKTTIKDVAYIIDKSGGSGGLPSSKSPASSIRAASDGNLGFLDNLGNEIAPQFINEQGDTVTSQISIAGMRDLNSDFMILSVSNTGNSDWTTNELLINKKTEATYELNRDAAHGTFVFAPYEFDIYRISQQTYSDADGNIYLNNNSPTGMVFKINLQNVNNVTMEEYLPPTENARTFIVDKAGICSYDGKFKCPGGRIYPYSELFPSGTGKMPQKILSLDGFLCLFFITEDDEYDYYKLVAPTNNELAVENLDKNEGDLLRSLSGSRYNPVRQTYFWRVGMPPDNLKVVEFDPATNMVTETGIAMPYMTYDGQTTSEFIYMGQQKLSKFSYADYSYSQNVVDFDQLGYEIYSITGIQTSPVLSFSALRYSDGSVIVGEIDSNGTVNILDERNSNGQVWTLTKLN